MLPDPKESSSLFELHFHSTSWKQPILTKGDTGAATEANCDKSKSITATIVEEYASNQEQWVLDFADVYDRMMANGYDINQLQVTLDSGIDVAPGINVAPLLKIFTSRF